MTVNKSVVNILDSDMNCQRADITKIWEQNTMANPENGLGNIMTLIRMCEELRENAQGSGLLDIMHIHIASYLWEALVVKEAVDGIPMQELHKNLGYKTSTQVHRKLYDLADNPKMVRGRGAPLGWFTIVDDPEDGRFKRIKLTEKGRDVAWEINIIGRDDRAKVNRIREEHEDLRATSKINYHLRAETGKFHWSAVGTGEAGSDPKRPIPIEDYRVLPPDEKARYQQGRVKFYWIDTETGHTWYGRPDRNPYEKTSRRKLEAFTHKEAAQMEKDNVLNKARGPMGQWHFWKPDADPYKDDPVGYLKDMFGADLSKYIGIAVDQVRADYMTPEDVMKKADWDLNKVDFQKFRKTFTKKLRDLRHTNEVMLRNAQKQQWDAAMREDEARKQSTAAANRGMETPSWQMHDKQAYFAISRNQNEIADSFAEERKSKDAEIARLQNELDKLHAREAEAEQSASKILDSAENKEALRQIIAEELARMRDEGGTDEGN
jgi:DNA-binding MarR family transcriptional regulator